MKNRNATFGIFLFSKSDNMPREYCPIKITDSYIMKCGERENLNFSYKLEKVSLSKIRKIKDEIDFHKISMELNSIEEEIKNIKNNMQAKVTHRSGAADYLKKNLENLYQHVNASIDKIGRHFGGEDDKK